MQQRTLGRVDPRAVHLVAALRGITPFVADADRS